MKFSIAQRVLLPLLGFIILGICLASSNYSWILVGGDEEILTPLSADFKTYEGEMTVADLGADFVDATQSVTYGTVTTDPPSGMGADSSTYSTLTEGSYTHTSYTTVTSYTGGSLPLGWNNYQWTFSGDYCYIHATPSINGGYFYTSSHTMTSYDSVRITFDWRASSKNKLENGDFLVKSNEGYLITVWSNADSPNDWTSVVIDRDWATSDWYVRFEASIEYYEGAETSEGVEVDNIYLYGVTENTYYRFSAVFRFDDVDYAWADFTLHVEFHSPYSEGYSFDIESGHSTPDNNVASGRTNDFYVDVSSYITGTTVYLRIYDTTGDDTDQDSGYISRCYLYASNTAPTNDAPPACSNLDDTDKLYAKKRKYQITQDASDADGYSDIANMALYFYDNDRTTSDFWVMYDEDNDSFLSGGTHPDHITLDTVNSSAIKSGNNIDVTYYVTIEWAARNQTDIDILARTVDTTGEYDEVYYEVNWDIETRLSLSSHNLDDGSGTTNRGDINGSVTASGIICYYGSSLHPAASSVDVYVSCPDVTSSPWEATNYDENTGEFSVTVQADDEVGSDTYYFRVVAEGKAPNDTNLLSSSQTATYISDAIICIDLSSPQSIVDTFATGHMEADLRYAYDSNPVIDGTYQLGNKWLAHQGGGCWQANHTPNTLTTITYNSITTATANAHGISSVNMNGLELAMYWEQLTCIIDGPTEDTIAIGENATGIHVYAEYYYWPQHGYRYYNGTLHLNSTIFQYDTVGTRCYIVSSADGDDTWGVTTILSSETICCTWVYPDPPPTWNVQPTNQIAEFGYRFSYALDANVSWGVDTWWLNDTSRFSISGTGVVTNATILSVADYPLQVWINDTFGRELTASFVVTVQDTTAPVWGEALVDQTAELLEPFRYVVVVIAEQGIDGWWLDDTMMFGIDSNGVVTNRTFLPVGVYGIQVFVNDTWGRVLSGSFSVVIADTRAPQFVDIPTLIRFEFGAQLREQLGASDFSGISHWNLNDTANFAITDEGLLFNLGLSAPGSYGLSITVFDNYDNYRTVSITVIVSPASPPSWVEVPVNQIIEFGDDFHYNLEAEDESGIKLWWLNDTSHFTVDNNGSIASIHDVPVGNYALRISVSDTLDYVQSAEFIITVRDTTSPEWLVPLEDLSIDHGIPVKIQLHAFDISGIARWTLNSSAALEINETGCISDIGVIPPGQYLIHVTAYDPYNNSISGTFLLKVNSVEWTSAFPVYIVVILVIGSVSVVFVLILSRKSIISRLQRVSTSLPTIQKRLAHKRFRECFFHG